MVKIFLAFGKAGEWLICDVCDRSAEYAHFNRVNLGDKRGLEK
jgi:hypothetical protein